MLSSWFVQQLAVLSFLILVRQSSSLIRAPSTATRSGSSGGNDEEDREKGPPRSEQPPLRRTLRQRQQELEELSGIKDGTSMLVQAVEAGGTLRGRNGREYSLSNLKPYTELFSPDNFAVSDDGTSVTNLRDGDTFKIPVSRARYYDDEEGTSGGGGTLMQTFFDYDEDGGEKLEFAEIRHHYSNGSSSDTFFVNANTARGNRGDSILSSEEEEMLLSFELSDIDITTLRENYQYGEEEAPPIIDDKKKKKQKKKGKKEGKKENDDDPTSNDQRQLLPNFIYRRGDGTSAECTYFKVVNLAIVYDSDFCQRYGSFAGARNRIVAIVASASLYYERDMCVKLRLTDIYTPDSSTCRGPSPAFRSFTRNNLCGSNLPHMLYDFSTWMSRTRRSLNINSKSLVHLMTGSTPPSGTLGCAWLGTMCWDSYSYGVEHMNFSGNNILMQSTILAHEIGHNLNAPHFESNSQEYVMEPRLSRGTDGFSATSANRILSFLDTKTCDDVALAPTPAPRTNNKPTFLLTSRPQPKPTRRPTKRPTKRPTRRPTKRPTKRPTPRPTKRPTKRPTGGSNTNSDCTDASNNDACVVEGKKGTYTCLGPADLLESRFGPGGGCFQSRSATVVLESCNGDPIRLASPSLGGFAVTAAEVDLSNDNEDENNGSNDAAAAKEKKKKGKEPSGGNGPGSFDSGDCKRSCVVVGDYVCLSAAKGNTHSVTFSARNSLGAMERFETTITVEKNAGCYAASTKCNDK